MYQLTAMPFNDAHSQKIKRMDWHAELTNCLQECNELGVKGNNIAQELAQLQHQLPGIYAEALTTINDDAITGAMQHYAAFTAYAHASIASDAPQANAEQLLPNLNNIRKLHTAAASDFGTQAMEGFSSTDAHQTSSGEEAQEQSADLVEIDWDVVASTETGAEAPADSSTGVDIDWDVAVELSEPNAEQAQPDTDAQGTDIDWDIDMTETAQEQIGSASGQDISPMDSDGNADQSVSGQNHQWPASAVQLSQDSACRTSLLDDLYELKSFLLQQSHELSSGELLAGGHFRMSALPASTE